jgi:hypothetical protein
VTIGQGFLNVTRRGDNKRLAMDEEMKKAWLHKVATENRYRAHHRANYEPKNLQSTGHPHLIDKADPNPPVVTNKPKARFSKVQRDYLKSAYWHFAVGGKLLRQEARHAFNVRSIYQEDSTLKPGDKVQDQKAANRSAKRSAKNLAEYGYVVLSYDGPPETYDMENSPNLYQPVLYITPTMAAVEKGREFCEQDGEPTDPEELKRRHEEIAQRMRFSLGLELLRLKNA